MVVLGPAAQATKVRVEVRKVNAIDYCISFTVYSVKIWS